MKINELLGTEFPHHSGRHGQHCQPALFAAAVSNAGALGLIGSGGMDADTLRKEIQTAKAATGQALWRQPDADEPPHRRAGQRWSSRKGSRWSPPAPATPASMSPPGKRRASRCFPVVAAPILAKRLERYDVDGFIAEGTESGGHVGEMTTMALVPQVVDAVKAPVIAAGGIADGRQMAAAFALGACGVQVGTCLLVSEECPIHENYKKALLKAGANDTVVTGAHHRRSRAGC